MHMHMHMHICPVFNMHMHMHNCPVLFAFYLRAPLPVVYRIPYIFVYRLS